MFLVEKRRLSERPTCTLISRMQSLHHDSDVGRRTSSRGNDTDATRKRCGVEETVGLRRHPGRAIGAGARNTKDSYARTPQLTQRGLSYSNTSTAIRPIDDDAVRLSFPRVKRKRMLASRRGVSASNERGRVSPSAVDTRTHFPCKSSFASTGESVKAMCDCGNGIVELPTPEICCGNLRVLRELGTGPAQDDAAAFHDVGAIGDGEGAAGVLFHQ